LPSSSACSARPRTGLALLKNLGLLVGAGLVSILTVSNVGLTSQGRSLFLQGLANWWLHKTSTNSQDQLLAEVILDIVLICMHESFITLAVVEENSFFLLV
jgi:hypothetical protein